MQARGMQMRSCAGSSSRTAVAFKAAPCATRRVAAAPIARRQLSVVVKAELKVGDKMSDCPEYYRVLRRSDGGSVSLSSYQGKQPVVLFFYPKAGTPGCTKEACMFRDEYKKFQDAGAAVFGISSDSPEENAAFAKQNNLQYPLLTDTSSILRKVFGIKPFMAFLPGRHTYVIDTNGKVVLSYEGMGAEGHVQQALEAVAKLPKPATVNA